MDENGVLDLHDNVVLQANTAGRFGGAVRIPFEIDSHLPVQVLRDTFGKG